MSIRECQARPGRIEGWASSSRQQLEGAKLGASEILLRTLGSHSELVRAHEHGADYLGLLHIVPLMSWRKSLEQFVDRFLGQNQSLVLLFRIKFLHDCSLPDHLAPVDELQSKAPLRDQRRI